MLFKKFSFEVKNKNCFVKDFDLNKFSTRFPEIKPLLKEMKSHIDEIFSYYLVDLIINEYKSGEKTCRDVRYHLDGDFNKNNQYCIWLSGKNRTIFSIEPIIFSGFPLDRNQQSIFLDNFLKEKSCFEAPDETIIKYDSLTPHKGVICKEPGRRVLLRLMGTNYIKPKNFIKKA